jgi:hypothetical protein
LIAGTATDVAGQELAQALARRVWLAVDDVGRADGDAGRANAALGAAELDQRRLDLQTAVMIAAPVGVSNSPLTSVA